VTAERALARIDLGAVERNCAHLRSLLGPDAELCAVVKSDAYGHGMRWVADAALAGGATWLAVATANEAADLRRHGVECRVLVMGALTPEDVRTALEAGGEVVAPLDAGGVGGRHGVGDGGVRHHVRLHRPTVAVAMAGLGDRALTGVGRDPSVGGDDGDLAGRGLGIVVGELGERLDGAEALGEEVEGLGSVADGDHGLGGDCADARTEPRRDRSDGEVVRLDGDPEVTRDGIAGDDRVRHVFGVASTLSTLQLPVPARLRLGVPVAVKSTDRPAARSETMASDEATVTLFASLNVTRIV